jgi:ATP-dependent Lon protease
MKIVAIFRRVDNTFIVDYLAQAFHDLRRRNFTEIIDRRFALGAYLNARDVKAVRKIVAGLVKLVYPDSVLTKDELAELVELAVEGRGG